MLGSRGIWHEGWKAVTTHPTIAGWSHFNDDTWELYHTDVDRSELHDLAEENPDKLRELQSLWFAEAGRNGAFPLDDRSPLEIILTPRPLLAPPRDRYAYFPDTADVPEAAGRQHPQPLVLDRGAASTSRRRAPRACCSRTARASAATPSTSRTTGCTTSTASSACSSRRSTRPRTCPTGENLILSASFDKDGEDPPGVATGILSLYYGDKKVGEGRIKTQPGYFSLAGEGLCVGRDSGEAVTDDYPGEAPHRFTGGTIKRVAVDVSGEPYVDLEREAVAMLAASDPCVATWSAAGPPGRGLRRVGQLDAELVGGRLTTEARRRCGDGFLSLGPGRRVGHVPAMVEAHERRRREAVGDHAESDRDRSRR